MKRYTITANKPLSQLCIKNDLTDFSQLTKWLRQLPYGRNKSRTNLRLLFKEKKGTCSSKHALIKAVADENSYLEFQLIIGLYKMSQDNTPGILNALQDFELSYLPEAHTYIRLENETIDVTNAASHFGNIESEVLQELVIQPTQIGQFKIDYHQAFLKQWIQDNNLKATFLDVWKVRERCIANLSLTNT